MLTILLLVLVVVLCLVELLVNLSANARTVKKIPGLKDVFFFGNFTAIFGLDSVQLFKLGRELAKKFNGIYRFYSLSVAAVNIYNPQDVEIVISTLKHHEKSVIYNFLKPWLNDGLLISKGSKWQERRKILTSAFHFNILRKYFLIIDENTRKLIKLLDENNEKTLDVTPILCEYTLNSISEGAMGVELDKDTSYSSISYKNAITEAINIIIIRFIRIYLYSDFIFKRSPWGIKQYRYLSIIHTFIRNVISQRKEYLKNNEIEIENIAEEDEDILYKKKKRMAMLDLLISAERNGLIDDNGILEEVNTFMFEGHDTTASCLTFCLLTLAENQDVQEKVLQELKSIGLCQGNTRTTTLEELSMMNYLERCIQESMRLYPPVPFISRKLTETVQLSNYTVPEGTMCHIHIYDMHRQESLFKNAEKFDPDRFLPENSANRHPYAYIPFSAGPRNCIGRKFAIMELKSALSAILTNYKVMPVTTSNDLEFSADLVLRNSKPVYLKFIKRY